jgi:hypothetical protein
MSDLLSKIKAGTDNVKLLDWPGSSQKVALRILSQRDFQDAIFSTERHFKAEKIEVNMVTAEEYDSEKATQILYRALRDPEHLTEPICPTVTAFRQTLTREEKAIILQEYVAFESECSPAPQNLSDEEFDKVFEDLKKNATTTLGSVTSLSLAKKLITTLVDQLVTLQTASGSSSRRSKE